MFAIESTNAKQWRWISGVVATRMEAEQLVSTIPGSERKFHRIIQIPIDQFPFFMVESRRFEFGGVEFVREMLHRLEKAGDEDQIHFNVYAFSAPFLPSVPGRDEMGGILHWHVTDATLRPPRAAAFDAELASIAGAA